MEVLDPRYEDEMADDPHRAVLPHDEEAERSVLAILLVDNARLDELDVTLREEDFYTRRHQLIYRQILRLKNENRAADNVTVRNALQDSDDLAAAGGKEYLLDLVALGGLNYNFDEYVHLVRDKSVLRRLRDETAEIQKNVHQPGERPCSAILNNAEERLFRLSDEYHNRRNDATQRIGELTEDINTKVTELYEIVSKGGDPITGVPTKFHTLDLCTSGLQKSDLIVLAARPSIGKTSFALEIVRNLCSRKNADDKYSHAAALFSLEMSSQQIAMRMVAAQGSINQHTLRTGRMHETKDWENFSASLAELERWPFWIDDTVNLSVSEMRSRARRMQRQCENNNAKLELIVVDYLQLMSGDNNGMQENRAVEVSNISRGLKSVARELEVPVIALSQMSRKIEDRTHKRPQLSDLRDSGGIEQDADVIMFLNRADQPPDASGSRDIVDIDLIIGKHRNGPTGEIKFHFNKRYTSFAEVEGQDSYEADVPFANPDVADADEYFSS